MSSVYYRVVLNTRTADLENVTRVYTKPYQVNVPKPIRMRGGAKMDTPADDDIRAVKPQQSINDDGFSFHHCNYEVGKDLVVNREFEIGLI
jgi:hypothetical protein